MKALKTIFKKTAKENSKIKVEKLDKSKLEKVVGGGDNKIGGKVNDPWITNTSAI